MQLNTHNSYICQYRESLNPVYCDISIYLVISINKYKLLNDINVFLLFKLPFTFGFSEPRDELIPLVVSLVFL